MKISRYGDLQTLKQRLDALLRSELYAHFSESLNGVSTIRAYGETARFCAENAARMDAENRCVWLRFMKRSRADGRSEVPTGCRLRLNDGSAFGWISSELCYFLQLLPWPSPPGTLSPPQRLASLSRTPSPPSKLSAG